MVCVEWSVFCHSSPHDTKLFRKCWEVDTGALSAIGHFSDFASEPDVYGGVSSQLVQDLLAELSITLPNGLYVERRKIRIISIVSRGCWAVCPLGPASANKSLSIFPSACIYGQRHVWRPPVRIHRASIKRTQL